MPKFLVVLALSSLACAPIYAPSALNLPMLNGARDAHVNAQLGTQGVQLNGAYAATDHLALRTTLQRFAQSPSMSGTRLNQVSGTAGLGYYWALGEETHGLRSSVNLDLGGGHVDGTFKSDSHQLDRAKGAFFQAATQADLAYQYHYLALGVAARVTYLAQFYEPETTIIHGTTGSFVFFEPAMVLRAGPPVFHFEAQLGLSIPFLASNSTGLINPVITSVGLGSNF